MKLKHLVIYHAHCTDGFGAAFAAWMKLGYEDVEYLPLNYGDIKTISDFGNAPKNPIQDDTTIYILDFSLPKEVMEWLFTTAMKVVWLDHHKTAFEMYDRTPDHYVDDHHLNLDPKHDVQLDNNRSGAMIAFNYFFPIASTPLLIQHIDDRDRWQFKLEGSAEIHAALAANKPWTFEQWETYLPTQDEFLGEINNMYDLYQNGAAILKAQNQIVKSMAEKAVRCVITWRGPDEEVGYIICDSTGLAINTNCFMSEVGHELANASGTYGLIYYLGSNGKAKCSLRSNGDYDVSAIAKAFGGGGHKNAAGFEIEVTTLLGWLK